MAIHWLAATGRNPRSPPQEARALTPPPLEAPEPSPGRGAGSSSPTVLDVLVDAAGNEHGAERVVPGADEHQGEAQAHAQEGERPGGHAAQRGPSSPPGPPGRHLSSRLGPQQTPCFGLVKSTARTLGPASPPGPSQGLKRPRGAYKRPGSETGPVPRRRARDPGGGWPPRRTARPRGGRGPGSPRPLTSGNT